MEERATAASHKILAINTLAFTTCFLTAFLLFKIAPLRLSFRKGAY
ncbi:MAG: hypothetical protein QGH51_10105 [Planctomycetota bacterium]|jgi:hypothetical protein|nr:hypothetical protein [Planctomycetota bacterium]